MVVRRGPEYDESFIPGKRPGMAAVDAGDMFAHRVTRLSMLDDHHERDAKVRREGAGDLEHWLP